MLYLDGGECGGEGISGCTDSDACNFNTDAACDDDGCIYPEPLFLIDELVLCDTIATLDGGGDFEEYLWSTGETTSSIQIFESGLYTVQRSSNPVNSGSLQFGGSGLGVAIEPIQSGVLEPGGEATVVVSYSGFGGLFAGAHQTYPIMFGRDR